MTPEELVKLRNDLLDATDKLTIKINEFKDDLKKLNLGVQAWVDISENVSMGYLRYKGEWDVFLSYDEFGETKSQPILDCNRQLRLHGYKHRLKLVEALENAAQGLLKRINKELGIEYEQSL